MKPHACLSGIPSKQLEIEDERELYFKLPTPRCLDQSPRVILFLMVDIVLHGWCYLFSSE